jgi:hypothetical protein
MIPLIDDLAKQIIRDCSPDKDINATVAGHLQHKDLGHEGVARVCGEVNRRLLGQKKTSSHTPLWADRTKTAKPDEVCRLLGYHPGMKEEAQKTSAPGENVVKTSGVKISSVAEAVHQLGDQSERIWQKYPDIERTKASEAEHGDKTWEINGREYNAEGVIQRLVSDFTDARTLAQEKISSTKEALDLELTGYADVARELKEYHKVGIKEVVAAAMSKVSSHDEAPPLLIPLFRLYGEFEKRSYDSSLFNGDWSMRFNQDHPFMQRAENILKLSALLKKEELALAVLENTLRGYQTELDDLQDRVSKEW